MPRASLESVYIYIYMYMYRYCWIFPLSEYLCLFLLSPFAAWLVLGVTWFSAKRVPLPPSHINYSETFANAETSSET